METKFNFFDRTFHQDIYQGMVDTQENHELVQTLIRMQTDAGISREDAAVMAGLCIAAVTSCESIRQELSGDAKAVVREILEDAEKSGDSERSLHMLYFGMAVYPEHVAEDTGISSDELFWRYYNENKGEKTCEELKNAIFEAVENYSLSPEVLRAMARKLGSSGDYLATAAALGEGGISFKCIAAMELYLKNRDTMTIHEAANIACAGVEIQAAADALSKGMITRETAKKILIVAGIALVVVGIGIVLYYAGGAAALGEAALNAKDIVMPMPEVFAGFATEMTAAGEPGFILNTAQSIRKSFYGPLVRAAENKQLIGGLVAAASVAMVCLSEKTANLIGKFQAGFTGSKASVTEGLQETAEHVTQSEAAGSHEDHQSVHTEVREKQQKKETVGVV